jgi:hypothetical protein
MFAMVAVEAKESKRAHPTLGWIDSSELREFGEGLIIIQSFGDRMPGVRCGNQIILSSRRCEKVSIRHDYLFFHED